MTSLGRQLPPKPQPGKMNELIPAGLRSPSGSRQLQLAHQVHAAHHLGGVDARHRGAQIGDLVRERDQRREQRVGGVLDELGRGVAGAQDRRVGEVAVELLLHLLAAPVDAADHDPVGAHEVVDRRALGQELGIHADAEVRPRPVRPEPSARIGSTTPSVVPGTTVLLTTTTW